MVVSQFVLVIAVALFATLLRFLWKRRQSLAAATQIF